MAPRAARDWSHSAERIPSGSNHDREDGLSQRITAVEKKKSIAIEIALQTHVLKTCPIHRQIYFDDDADAASAFALAIELVRKHKPYVQEFHHDEHELMDLLSDTLGATPLCCPDCQSSLMSGSQPDRSRFVESALEIP
jgi:hypothetical protein